MTDEQSLGREGSLWMGDVMDYMDENFIIEAFRAMDETVHFVKKIRNKFTGLYAGYCFVHFKDNQTALRVMHKLNGKMVPNSHPPTRFMLNHSNANKSGQEREYSLWVGDLDVSVDDSELYKAFATRYSTVRAAKVVYDKTSGQSRGYAFVRFGSEEEHKDALTHMNGFTGLANKPIRVSVAVPKRPTASTANTANTAANDYSAYYEQYWYNYHAWQNYGCYDPSAYEGYGYDHQAHSTSATTADAQVERGDADDDKEVVEHDVPVDVERQNREFVLRNEEFWDALDASRWLQPDTLNPELGMVIKT